MTNEKMEEEARRIYNALWKYPNINTLTNSLQQCLDFKMIVPTVSSVIGWHDCENRVSIISRQFDKCTVSYVANNESKTCIRNKMCFDDFVEGFVKVQNKLFMIKEAKTVVMKTSCFKVVIDAVDCIATSMQFIVDNGITFRSKKFDLTGMNPHDAIKLAAANMHDILSLQIEDTLRVYRQSVIMEEKLFDFIQKYH